MRSRSDLEIITLYYLNCSLSGSWNLNYNLRKTDILRKFYFFFTFLSASSERNQRDDQGEGRLRSLPSPWNPNSFKRLFVLSTQSSLPALSAFRTLRSAWLFGSLFLRTQHTFELFAPNFYKPKTKNALAGAFSAVTCSQNSLVLFERIFCCCSHPFLFAFFVSFLSFFFRKKKRKK